MQTEKLYSFVIDIEQRTDRVIVKFLRGISHGIKAFLLIPQCFQSPEKVPFDIWVLNTLIL